MIGKEICCHSAYRLSNPVGVILAPFCQNEDEVGAAMAEKIAAGVVKREELFVTTKCWCTFHSKAKARECLLTSLKSLRLDYIDLYLIHWPMGFKVGEGGGIEQSLRHRGRAASVLLM